MIHQVPIAFLLQFYLLSGSVKRNLTVIPLSEDPRLLQHEMAASSAAALIQEASDRDAPFPIPTRYICQSSLEFRIFPWGHVIRMMGGVAAETGYKDGECSEMTSLSRVILINLRNGGETHYWKHIGPLSVVHVAQDRWKFLHHIRSSSNPARDLLVE